MGSILHLDLKAISRWSAPGRARCSRVLLAGNTRNPEVRSLDVEAQHQASVATARPTDELSAEPPVDGASTLDVPRADGHVRALVDELHQPGQIARIMAEVGVHLDDRVVVALESPGEAGQIGGSQAKLAFAVQRRALAGFPVPAGLQSRLCHRASCRRRTTGRPWASRPRTRRRPPPRCPARYRSGTMMRGRASAMGGVVNQSRRGRASPWVRPKLRGVGPVSPTGCYVYGAYRLRPCRY